MVELAAYLFLVSLLLMGVLTPLCIKIGQRFGIVDHPGNRKIHAHPIPLTGGWAIFISLTVLVWGHLLGAWVIRGTAVTAMLPEQLRFFIDLAPTLVVKIAPVYAGAVGVFVLGILDDLRGMSVKSRLVYQAAIAGFLVAFGLRPQLGFLPSWIAALIGAIWIIGITNSFNFLDGLDGLSTGVALVGTGVLLTIMGIGNQPDMIFLMAGLAGIQLGFLRYNFQPARVFLGSSGSLLLGYLLAMCTLLVTYMHGGADNWLMPLLTPLFILAVPIYDTISVVLIRLIQNRPVAIGDQSHFHHRLLKLGFSHRQAVVFIYLIALAVALSAVRLIGSSLGHSLLILLQIVGILAILVIAERVSIRARSEILQLRNPPSSSSKDEDRELAQQGSN